MFTGRQGGGIINMNSRVRGDFSALSYFIGRDIGVTYEADFYIFFPRYRRMVFAKV